MTLKLFQRPVRSLVCLKAAGSQSTHVEKTKKGGGSEGELVSPPPIRHCQSELTRYYRHSPESVCPLWHHKESWGSIEVARRLEHPRHLSPRCVAVKQHAWARASKFKAEKTQRLKKNQRKTWRRLVSISLYLILIIWRGFYSHLKNYFKIINTSLFGHTWSTKGFRKVRGQMSWGISWVKNPNSHK